MNRRVSLTKVNMLDGMAGLGLECLTESVSLGPADRSIFRTCT